MESPTKLGSPAAYRLPFGTLGLARLTDLCAALVFPLVPWHSLARGEGASGEPTFVGHENTGTGTRRQWWIHLLDGACIPAPPRSSAFAGMAVAQAPDVLLLIAPFSASAVSVQTVEEHRARLGASQAMAWDPRILEQKLRVERPDLLFAFFGITAQRDLRLKVRVLQRRVRLKQRMTSDFVLPGPGHGVTAPNPYAKLRYGRVLLRSVDDDAYPSPPTQSLAPSWLDVATYDLYHDGLEVIVGTTDVAIDAHGRWAPYSAGANEHRTASRLVRAHRIGRIPFAHIATYDVMGDEYHSCPHVFCVFAAAGMPFAEYRYASVDDPYRVALDPALRRG